MLTVYVRRGNVKWPFSLSNNRVQTGGWARQQNGRSSECVHEPGSFITFPSVNVMPIATEMAAVDMRLEAGAIR